MVSDGAGDDGLQRRRRGGARDQEAAGVRRSCWAVATKTCHGGPSCSWCRCTRRSSSPASRRTQRSPTTVAVARLATKRVSTTSGCPGKATAVATMTTGLMAGADRRNASAAAGTTPRDMSRRAIGTEPHSQPGSTTPAAAATGTASAGRLGRRRGRKSAGTNAAMAPLTTTPRTRKGSAWKAMATKIVVQLWTAGALSRPRASWPTMTTPSTRPANRPTPGRLGARSFVDAEAGSAMARTVPMVPPSVPGLERDV
jgi:hypothetical protein